MGFSRQEYWSGLPCPPPRDLPGLEIKPRSLMFPALASGFFTTRVTWEVHLFYKQSHKYVNADLPIHPILPFPPWYPYVCSLRLGYWPLGSLPLGLPGKSIYFINSHINMSILISQFTPSSLFPLGIHTKDILCSLCLGLYFFFVSKIIYTNLFRLHICVNIWYLFFSFWLTSLHMIASKSVHVKLPLVILL